MSVAYQAVSVEDREAAEDLKARYLREQAERQQSRVRCGFLCVFLLVPAAILIALANGKGRAEWKPEPRRDAAGWRPTHQSYVREIRQTGQDLNLVFYGDSITESWRGTSRGTPVDRAEGIPNVWDEYFGGNTNISAAAYGISGDYTKHLKWRLQHGEVVKGMGPSAVVLLIGTNDLAQCAFLLRGCVLAEVTPKVAEHVLDIASLLHDKLPSAHVLVNAVMPRASNYSSVHDTMPDSFYKQPSLFTEDIATLNKIVQEVVSGWPWATFLDCTDSFLTADKHYIDRELMPDGLHPGVNGSAKWAECMLPTLRKHLRM